MCTVNVACHTQMALDYDQYGGPSPDWMESHGPSVPLELVLLCERTQDFSE